MEIPDGAHPHSVLIGPDGAPWYSGNEDATIVRIVLVPATMRLLGRWNWWLPGWLDRLLPNLDVEGGAGLPEPEYEPGRGPAPAPDGIDGDVVPAPALTP